MRQRVCITKARAKEARKLVERLITLGKKGTLAHKRRAFSILCDHDLVSDLFTKIAPRFNNRNGGYTRIIKLGQRRGDSAELAFLELTEKEVVVAPQPKTTATAKVKEAPKAAPVKKDAPKSGEAVKVEKKPVPSQPMPKKHDSAQEKAKVSKPMLGGIKKMFTRKVGGE